MKAIAVRIVLASLVLTFGETTHGDSDTKRRMQKLEKAIAAEIGVPSATDVEQCAAIAFGAKPCGGPWRHLVYSTAVSDVKRLTKLVARYYKLEKKFNREEGRISDCAMVGPPRVERFEGVCRRARN